MIQTRLLTACQSHAIMPFPSASPSAAGAPPPSLTAPPRFLVMCHTFCCPLAASRRKRRTTVRRPANANRSGHIARFRSQQPPDGTTVQHEAAVLRDLSTTTRRRLPMCALHWPKRSLVGRLRGPWTTSISWYVISFACSLSRAAILSCRSLRVVATRCLNALRVAGRGERGGCVRALVWSSARLRAWCTIGLASRAG